MILNYIQLYIQIKNIFLSLPTTFQVQKTKEAFIEGKKEEEGMKEEGLWQNQNHWILGWIKKPGIISPKENLMKKRKKLLETNQHSYKPNDQGQ